MDTLFIVKESPFVISESLMPLKWVKPSDGVVFIHEGIYIAKKRPENLWSSVKNLKAKGVPLYMLKADVDARALKEIPPIFEVVDYDRLIDFITSYQRVFS